MKKLYSSALFIGAFAMSISFNACKKKGQDAELKIAIENSLKAVIPAVSATKVTVDKGIVTISGECADQAGKDRLTELAKKVKGVNDVVNNCTIGPLPVVIADNESLTSSLKDALKDFPGVNSSVTDGKIALTGEITKAKWAWLKPLLDRLRSKGYDLAGLKIN